MVPEAFSAGSHVFLYCKGVHGTPASQEGQLGGAGGLGKMVSMVRKRATDGRTDFGAIVTKRAAGMERRLWLSKARRAVWSRGEKLTIAIRRAMVSTGEI